MAKPTLYDLESAARIFAALDDASSAACDGFIILTEQMTDSQRLAWHLRCNAGQKLEQVALAMFRTRPPDELKPPPPTPAGEPIVVPPPAPDEVCF